MRHRLMRGAHSSPAARTRSLHRPQGLGYRDPTANFIGVNSVEEWEYINWT
jgi:hypothetical protein